MCIRDRIRVRPITYFGLTLAYHIWPMGVSSWDDVSHSWSHYDFDLLPQGRFTGFLTCFCFRSIIMLGYYVWHHERMGCLHSSYGFDIDLWPQGQIYRFLSCLRVRPVTFVCFDVGIPYLANGSITTRGCVAYIHDPDTLIFDLKVTFIGFMIWLCVPVTAFLSFDIVIILSLIHIWRCRRYAVCRSRWSPYH